MAFDLAGKKFASLAACILLALGTIPGGAQDTEGLGTIVAPLEPKRGVGLPDQAPAKAEAPVAVPGTAAANPSVNKSPRNADAQAANPGISETAFSDWSMECLTQDATGPCQVVHRALSADKQQVVVVMSMAVDAKTKETKIQMALPLGFAVQPGVSVDIGGDYKDVFQVSRCTVQGCLVDGVIPDDMIAAMAKGKSGAVSVKTVEGSEISLPLSLSGFKAAYDEMKKRNAASPA